jgi:hypothetical protein
VKEVKLLDVDGNVKMKKRKLNSTNPKYHPSPVEIIKENKVLIASGKVKVYAVFSEIE